MTLICPLWDKINNQTSEQQFPCLKWHTGAKAEQWSSCCEGQRGLPGPVRSLQQIHQTPQTARSLLELIVSEKKREEDHLPWRCTLGISFILFERNKSTTSMLSQNNFLSKVKGWAESGHSEKRAHLAGSRAVHLLLLQHEGEDEEEEREKSAWWMEVQWRGSFCSWRYLSLQHWSLLSHQTFWLQLWRHLVDVPQPRLVGLQVLHPT